MRVDDYFKFGCGNIIRERDGRHLYRVRAVVYNRIIAVALESGWVSEFQAFEVVKHEGEI